MRAAAGLAGEWETDTRLLGRGLCWRLLMRTRRIASAFLHSRLLLVTQTLRPFQRSCRFNNHQPSRNAVEDVASRK